MATKDGLLDDFATRSFRDTGDFDYVAARAVFRLNLPTQFYWSGLQAIEKYIKYILLINRIKGQSVRHDLRKGLRLLNKSLPFPIDISEKSREFLELLSEVGPNRYFESTYAYDHLDIVRLDKLVWEFRRYCQPIARRDRKTGKTVGIDREKLQAIETATARPHHEFQIPGGTLEKVVLNRKHPARDALIWKNLYFGSVRRKTVSIGGHSGFANAPLSMRPSIIDDVLGYVYIPAHLVREFRADKNEMMRKLEQRVRKTF